MMNLTLAESLIEKNKLSKYLVVVTKERNFVFMKSLQKDLAELNDHIDKLNLSI